MYGDYSNGEKNTVYIYINSIHHNYNVYVLHP